MEFVCSRSAAVRQIVRMTDWTILIKLCGGVCACAVDTDFASEFFRLLCTYIFRRRSSLFGFNIVCFYSICCGDLLECRSGVTITEIVDDDDDDDNEVDKKDGTTDTLAASVPAVSTAGDPVPIVQQPDDDELTVADHEVVLSSSPPASRRRYHTAGPLAAHARRPIRTSVVSSPLTTRFVHSSVPLDRSFNNFATRTVRDSHNTTARRRSKKNEQNPLVTLPLRMFF